jgi:hypothetical protein
MNELKKHPRPAWGARADFAIQLRIVTGDARLDNPPRFEELVCQDLGEGFYRICCVPMFLYDLALGDVLKINDGELEGVAQESGQHTFRAYFGKAFMPFAREVLIDELATMAGVITEWFSNDLLGISAENDAVANELARWLETAMSRGQLQYETGRTH